MKYIFNNLLDFYFIIIIFLLIIFRNLFIFFFFLQGKRLAIHIKFIEY